MIEISVKSPERLHYEGSSKSITLPGADGQLQILTGHAPILAWLQKGNVVIETSEGKKSIKINEGVLNFEDNRATILVV